MCTSLKPRCILRGPVSPYMQVMERKQCSIKRCNYFQSSHFSGSSNLCLQWTKLRMLHDWKQKEGKQQHISTRFHITKKFSRTSLPVAHSTESPRSHKYSSPPSSSNSKPSVNMEEFLCCLRDLGLDACSQIVSLIPSPTWHGNGSAPRLYWGYRQLGD